MPQCFNLCHPLTRLTAFNQVKSRRKTRRPGWFQVFREKEVILDKKEEVASLFEKGEGNGVNVTKAAATCGPTAFNPVTDCSIRIFIHNLTRDLSTVQCLLNACKKVNSFDGARS